LLRAYRAGILAAILAGSLIFLPPFKTSVMGAGQRVKDFFDSRPQETVLFIGNSRTFYNDMPFMIRKIADSTGYDKKLRVEMDAQPSVSLAYHATSPKTQALLAQGWDHVVLQVLSSEQYSAQQSGQAWEVAAGLIRQIQNGGSRPAMFVTWRYTDQCTAGAGMPPAPLELSPSGYAHMHTNIQQQHARLSAVTGVDLVNVGLVWEDLQRADPGFSLYHDCNHPSIHGSYLAALMFYGYLSGRDVADVTYKPSEISLEDAQELRTVVSRYLTDETRSASRPDGIKVSG
jgi:hypothetical protein